VRLAGAAWCRRRGCRARRWWPPHRWWPGSHRAAVRIAPAAPRSAGPSPGRARSPPEQGIEHKFESESRTLPSPTVGPLTARGGRAGAATRRNLGDSNRQQETTDVEVSSGFAAIHLGSETPGLRFHTAEATGSCETHLYSPQGRPCGRPPAAAVLGRQDHRRASGPDSPVHRSRLCKAPLDLSIGRRTNILTATCRTT
jgi:hypothetical protein